MNDRIPCSDESCIGIINEKGICNICGKPFKSAEKDRDEKIFDFPERISSKEPCKSCGQQAEPNYLFPLCPTCRELLSKRPLPKWVKLSFFLVILITLFAATKFPKSLVGGIAFERGRMAEESHDFSSAVENYSETLNHFPNSPWLIARLGIAQQKAGDISASRKTLNKIVGQKLPKEIIREVNETFRNQDQEIRSLQSMISKSKKELASIEEELKGLSDSIESLKTEIDKIEASLKERKRRALEGFKVDQNQPV
jgi:soluble cytochrome b562